MTSVAATKKVYVYEPSSPIDSKSHKKVDGKTSPSKTHVSTYQEVLKKFGPNGVRKENFKSPPKKPVTMLGPYSTLQQNLKHPSQAIREEPSISQPTAQQMVTKELIDHRVEEHRRDLMEQKMTKKEQQTKEEPISSSSPVPMVELPTLEQSPSPFISGIPIKTTKKKNVVTTTTIQQQLQTEETESISDTDLESVITEEDQLISTTNTSALLDEEVDEKVDVMKLKERLSSYLKENLKPIPTSREPTPITEPTMLSKNETNSSLPSLSSPIHTPLYSQKPISSPIKVKQSLDLFTVNDNFQGLQTEIEECTKHLSKRLEELKKFEQEFQLKVEPTTTTETTFHEEHQFVSPKPTKKQTKEITKLTPTALTSHKEKLLLECKKLLHQVESPIKIPTEQHGSSTKITIPPLPIDLLSSNKQHSNSSSFSTNLPLQEIDSRQSVISLSQFSPIRPVTKQQGYSSPSGNHTIASSKSPSFSLEAPFSPLPLRNNISITPTELAIFSVKQLEQPRPLPTSPLNNETEQVSRNRSSSIGFSTIPYLLHSSYLLQSPHS